MINDEKEVEAMLKAIRKDGTPFQLLPRHAKEVLRKEKSDNEFFCPECKEKVTMKMVHNESSILLIKRAADVLKAMKENHSII